jgi:choline dehydrogenase
MGASARGSSILAAAALLLAHACLPIVLGNIVYNGKISKSYDFVIVGGGLAGLVLASRLSEDANHTVLVLEAGASGDAVIHQIDVPANAYYSSLLGTSYDWQYTTEPQTNAGERPLPWPRGKVLGGSTAVNGAFSFKCYSRLRVW